MKKIPVLVTVLLIAGVLASMAFTHPISSRNGVVTDYSPGRSITIHTSNGEQTYVLRAGTLMLGLAANGIANTGGTTSSSSSSSSASGTATPSTGAAGTATPSTGTSATATPSSGGSGSGATGATANTNVLGTGARVTVFAQCFGSQNASNGNGLARSTNGKSNSARNAQMNSNMCMALAIVVRAPALIPATGGTAAPGATSTTAAPATTGTPAVTGTPGIGTETPTPTATP